MRKLLALAVIGCVIAAFFPAVIVSAHSRPVRFDPAPGAVLEQAPSTVRGWFSSDLRRDEGSFLQVLDTAKNRVDTGETQLSSDRRSMTATLRPDIGPGAYLVHWSTYDDADNEVFTGCHYFYVGQAAADAAVSQGRALDGGDACPAVAPAHQASVSFDVKTDGRDATLTIQPVNFTNNPPDGSSRLPDRGHYHIYLDKAPLDVIEGHTHDESGGHTGSGGDEHGGHGTSTTPGLLENPVQWFDNTYTFKDLAPGQHTIAVSLFHDDHTPLSPPVLAEKTITIAGDGEGGGIPLWALILGVMLALGGGLAAGKLIAGRPE